MSKEYPCVYHKDGLCEKFTEPGYVSYCVLGPCTEETPSNADRIRAMSDEELISLLCGGYGGFDCHTCKIGDQRQCDMECKEHCRQWLQQPAEGGS